MNIQVLPPETIDQIAAGEVVERPSHLVKELVENSLDAGARRVEIEVEDGGRAVRVRDDGRGMSVDDLRLACARHATSKIASADDLWSLHTFGFRGEALASIGAVSFLKITTRREEDAYAHTLECLFGKMTEPMRSGTDQGTVVEIADLFENVPARLKFLKSETAESTQIKNTIKAVALAHPEVEFILRINGKMHCMYAKSESLIARAADVTETSDLFFTSDERDGYAVDIVYSSPNTTAKTSRQIWTFVQNRWVTDRGIQAAVTEAYRTLLMHGEYPIAVVKVRTPTEDVDVNIHPAKSQVKFVDQSRIFRLVHHTLRRALEQAPWMEALKRKNAPVIAGETTPSTPVTSGAEAIRAATESYVRADAERVEMPTLAFSGHEFQRTQYASRTLTPTPQTSPPQTAFSPVSAQNPTTRPAPIFDEPAPAYLAFDAPVAEDAPSFWSSLRVIGQSHLTYIIAESKESLFLIDQHAAHERVMFERLMEGRSKKNLEVQSFLIPLAVDLSAEHCEALIAQKSSLAEMGLQVESGGPETILVEAAPAMVNDKAVTDVLSSFAEDLVAKGGGFSIERKIADLFATMACHSAIRAGHAMSLGEMEALLKQMDEFRLSSYCPHGRNVYVEIAKTKIERDFGRIV